MCKSEHIDALLTFLEPINEYDREEVVAAICSGIDVKSRSSIRKLLDEQYFFDSWYSGTSIDVKRELSAVLLDAMRDEEFDFEWLTHDAEGTFCLPGCFDGVSARMLYEEIYRAVFDHWGEGLMKAGLLLVAPSELGISSLSA